MLESVFESEKELRYRNSFSSVRYKIFLLLEKIYKKIIDDTDNRITTIIKYLATKNPKRVLEIGSGTLPIYKFIPEKQKKYLEYHICEVNPEKILFINKNYPNIKTIRSDALNLPYKKDSFDLVLSKGVLHHIDDKNINFVKIKRKLFIKEMMRITKNNGSIFLMDFSGNKSFGSLIWHFLHKFFFKEGEHNFYSLKESLELFRKKPLKKVSGKELGTFKGIYYYIIADKKDEN